MPDVCPDRSLASQVISCKCSIFAYKEPLILCLILEFKSPKQEISRFETPNSSLNHVEICCQSAHIISPVSDKGNQVPSIGASSVHTGGLSIGIGRVVKSAKISSPLGQLILSEFGNIV